MDGGADSERLIQARQSAGKDVELRFDANPEYSGSVALRFVEAVRVRCERVD